MYTRGIYMIDILLLGKKEEVLMRAKGFQCELDNITGLYKLQKDNITYYAERLLINKYYYYNIVLGCYRGKK